MAITLDVIEGVSSFTPLPKYQFVFGLAENGVDAFLINPKSTSINIDTKTIRFELSEPISPYGAQRLMETIRLFMEHRGNDMLMHLKRENFTLKMLSNNGCVVTSIELKNCLTTDCEFYDLDFSGDNCRITYEFKYEECVNHLGTLQEIIDFNLERKAVCCPTCGKPR